MGLIERMTLAHGPRASRVFDLSALAKGPVQWARWRGEEGGRDRVDICWLYGGAEASGSSALLRYAPDARVPPHEHTGYEQIFVLSGFQRDELGEYHAGTMVINAPGSRHSIWAPEGCVALVVWAAPIVFLHAE